VAQAQSEKRRTALDLEIAHSALREYEAGLRHVRRREFERRLALARAEVARLVDRCKWTRRMLNKGYLARAQAATEMSLHRRTERQGSGAGETTFAGLPLWLYDASKRQECVVQSLLAGSGSGSALPGLPSAGRRS
jgi:hypothetical protein